ncbi:MAG: hypothetical protein N2746_07155 [Deltaproteobacteria bacterium]|nr:hypothetical protein [Deltaproteobacteria bacterium]
MPFPELEYQPCFVLLKRNLERKIKKEDVIRVLWEELEVISKMDDYTSNVIEEINTGGYFQCMREV